jgi:hypothetical protein
VGDTAGDGNDDVAILSQGTSSGVVWQVGESGEYSRTWAFDYGAPGSEPFGATFAHLNGDDRAELVISAERSVFVVPGSEPRTQCLPPPGGAPSQCAPSFEGLELEAATPLSAASASGGDINGDGQDDIVVTAGDTSYVLFAWDTATDAHIRGVSTVSRLGERDGQPHHTPGDDRLLEDGSIVRVDGGRGVDTLVVSSAELDLADGSTRVSSIEIIDLRGGGPQRLSLSDASIRRIPGNRRDLPVPLSRALSVLGDADDTLVFSGDEAYALAGTLDDGRLLFKRPNAAYGVLVSPEVRRVGL